jgi:hypothetical protein
MMNCFQVLLSIFNLRRYKMGLLHKDATMYDEEPVYLTVAQKTERKMRLEHVEKQRAALAAGAYTRSDFSST